MARGLPWGEAEDRILKDLYPRYGAGACQRELPERTKKAIQYRATVVLRLAYDHATKRTVPHKETYSPIPVPPDTRNLTARILGDPIFERSALAQKINDGGYVA